MTRFSSITNKLRWILICVSVSACLDTYDTALSKHDFGILVVDGFFTPNDTTKIKLSRTSTIDYVGSPSFEVSATVQIENEQGDAYVMQSLENGVYVLPPVNADLNANYRLHIFASDGAEYNSDYSNVAASHQIDSVTWKEKNDVYDVVAFQIYGHDPKNLTKYYYWTYDETWQYSSSDFSVYYFENGQILPRHLTTDIYYCWRTLANQDFFLGNTSSLAQDVVYDYYLTQFQQRAIKFYYGYSMLLRQYGISDKAFAYWQMTKKNSENLGTLFDPLPDQPQSNIRCITQQDRKVVGYFSASLVSKKRIFISRQQLKGPLKYDPTGYELCPQELINPADMDESHLLNKLIAHAVYDKDTGILLGYAVARKECIDCRYHGGTIVKPDYWP